MLPAVPVPPSLQRYVAARMAYDVDFGAPGVHRGLPSTTLTFVLPIDEPITVSWPATDLADRRLTSWAMLGGLSPAPAAIHHNGLQRGIQLALTVAGARALLGRPAGDLAGEVLDLDQVLPELAALPERLHDETSWVARVRVVDRALTSLLARRGEVAPRAEVGRALARLTRGARVAEVAAEVGYSRRRLTELVREECGLTPMDLRRIARFTHAKRLLNPATTVADVAAASGFSDHAHLTREWRALAGCTPSTWLHEEFPFVQAPEWFDREGWDHG